MNTVNHYTDFANAEKYAKDYHAVISIGVCMPEEFRIGKKFLFLDFQDEDFDSIRNDPFSAKQAPTEKHIQQLVAFIKELQPVDKLLIHCYAGFSRSPAAVAIAKCERDGKSLNTALRELYDARIPDKLHPDPNKIMLHNYIIIK